MVILVAWKYEVVLMYRFIKTQNIFTNVYDIFVKKINTQFTFTKFTKSFNKNHKEYQCWLPL